MTKYQPQFDRLMTTLVAEVSAVAREVIASAFADALRESPRASRRTTPATQRPRRTNAELTATTNRLRAFIARHPGMRIEAINDHLGTTTAELRLPLIRLLRDHEIRAEGARRSTAYFAVEQRG